MQLKNGTSTFCRLIILLYSSVYGKTNEENHLKNRDLFWWWVSLRNEGSSFSFQSFMSYHIIYDATPS